jgi:tetrahydromethanopterin S-methyltransferase subunit B
MDKSDEIIYAILPIGERVASLETRQEHTEETLNKIVTKLDELLELKQKGMGAVKLVSILAVSASGIVGFVAFIINFLSGKH